MLRAVVASNCLRCCFAFTLIVSGAGCAALMPPKKQDPHKMELDRQAMALTMEQSDIEQMVGDFMARLEPSSFWQQTVRSDPKKAVVAVWPLQDATGEHLDVQTRVMLAWIEGKLARTNSVEIADRSRQGEIATKLGVKPDTDLDTAVAQKLGRELGARYFISGKLTSSNERTSDLHRVKYSLFLQLLDVDTGLIRFHIETARIKVLPQPQPVASAPDVTAAAPAAIAAPSPAAAPVPSQTPAAVPAAVPAPASPQTPGTSNAQTPAAPKAPAK